MYCRNGVIWTDLFNAKKEVTSSQKKLLIKLMSSSGFELLTQKILCSVLRFELKYFISLCFVCYILNWNNLRNNIMGAEIFTIPHQKQAVIREALFLKALHTILELSMFPSVRIFPSGVTFKWSHQMVWDQSCLTHDWVDLCLELLISYVIFANVIGALHLVLAQHCHTKKLGLFLTFQFRKQF